MTVIAWDGDALAADKRVLIGGSLIRTTTKIIARRGCLLGFSGNATAAAEMLAWFSAGADLLKFPTEQRYPGSRGTLLVVHADKTLWWYENSPYPTVLPPQNFAVGCGRDYAMMAMHLGKTAAEAVGLTALFESTCGNGVDVLRHANSRWSGGGGPRDKGPKLPGQNTHKE